MSWDDLRGELAELFGEHKLLDEHRSDVAMVNQREHVRALYRERWRTDRKFREDRKLYFRARRLLATKPLAIEEDERHL